LFPNNILISEVVIYRCNPQLRGRFPVSAEIDFAILLGSRSPDCGIVLPGPAVCRCFVTLGYIYIRAVRPRNSCRDVVRSLPHRKIRERAVPSSTIYHGVGVLGPVPGRDIRAGDPF